MKLSIHFLLTSSILRQVFEEKRKGLKDLGQEFRKLVMNILILYLLFCGIWATTSCMLYMI